MAQAALLEQATKLRDDRVHPAATIEEAAEAAATLRCLQRDGSGFADGLDDPEVDAIVARAY